MPFCTNCGQPITANNRFCGSCGAPAGVPGPGGYQTPVPVPPPPPFAQQPVSPPANYGFAPPSESIKFIISNLIVMKSFGRSDSYTLVITERRSIFAKVTKEIVNEAINASRANAEAQGKGFFGKWAAQISGAYNYAARYNGFTPDQALNETPGNFAIDNATIHQIKIRQDRNEENTAVVLWDIEFQTTAHRLSYKSQYDPRGLFAQAFGTAVVR